MSSMHNQSWRVVAAGLLIALCATGCATSSSMNFPWEKRPTSRNLSTCTAQTDEDADKADASKTAKQIERAQYWARQAVTSSRHIAYAQGIRAATSNTGPMLAKTTIKEPPKPSGEAESEPKTRQIAREADAAEEAAADEPSASTAKNSTPDPQPTTARTVRRKAPSAATNRVAGWPVGIPDDGKSDGGRYAPMNPTSDNKVIDLTVAKQRKAIAEEHGISLPKKKGAVAIEGTFITNIGDFEALDDIDEEARENQICIVVPGKRIAFYAGDEEIASLDFDKHGKLPDALAKVRPVEVVDDGTTQVLFYWAESNEKEKEVRYKASVVKVFGPFVGHVFKRTIGRKAARSKPLQREGYVEFLTGKTHRHIRWTPAAEDGEAIPEEAKVLEFNKWEGIFRVPTPPPTAPDQRS